MSEAETLKYLLRRDFYIFVEHCFAHLNPGQVLEPNWHIELLSWWAEQVRKGEKQRIIVALPPRSLKSIIFSVAFPAFLLGHNPSMNIGRQPQCGLGREALVGLPQSYDGSILSRGIPEDPVEPGEEYGGVLRNDHEWVSPGDIA